MIKLSVWYTIAIRHVLFYYAPYIVNNEKLARLKFGKFGKLRHIYLPISLVSIHTCNSGWIRQTFFHQADLLADLPNFSPTSFSSFTITTYVDSFNVCSTIAINQPYMNNVRFAIIIMLY